jgi:hypothetical protein
MSAQFFHVRLCVFATHDRLLLSFLGALAGNILIDTSQVATDTIDYVATDTWGNTATSTRTVIVEAATSSFQ